MSFLVPASIPARSLRGEALADCLQRVQTAQLELHSQTPALSSQLASTRSTATPTWLGTWSGSLCPGDRLTTTCAFRSKSMASHLLMMGSLMKVPGHRGLPSLSPQCPGSPTFSALASASDSSRLPRGQPFPRACPRRRILAASCSPPSLPSGPKQTELHRPPLMKRDNSTRNTARATRPTLDQKAHATGNTARVTGSANSLASDSNSALTTFEEPSPLDFTVVMKFGGSSIANADRMKEVARLVLSFEQERPVLILSAMGKTTNKLIELGEGALTCGAPASRHLAPLREIRELHVQSAKELGIECPEGVALLLEELEQLVTGIALMRELTDRTRDYLMSFGERLSTRLFAAYLCSLGINSKQFDAFEIGVTTTDEFNNSDVLDETYPAVKACLSEICGGRKVLPVITGFLGKGQKTGAITTLGRGGSDLTATVVGRALGLREVQVWKDVDGVLTCDPRICPSAKPIPCLTFEEASELAYFGAQVLHPQSMRPAREANLPVRVKNSYNPSAPGTQITLSRDLSESLLTCIVLKSHVTLLDIVSTRMLGQFGFLAKVFSIFEAQGISVDVVATSEVSVSLTLDPARLWSRALIQQELDSMVERLSSVATVKLLQNRAIISLIGNVERSSDILQRAFRVLQGEGINVQMISQGASKVNISIVVDDHEAEGLVKCLHQAFFEAC